MFISRYAYRSRGCKHDQSLPMLTLFMADANKPLSLELYSRSILKIYPQKEHKVTQGHWRYRPEFSKLSSLIIKFMRMTAVIMVTWNPEGRVLEVFRLNQLLTKMWVPWALPSSWVCCWSVISGSREYFVISFRPETIFLTWYENQTKKFEQTEFISKPMFNSFKLEIVLSLQPCYLFSPIYFLLRYFCIIHFSFQIDMQCKLKLNSFLVRLFAELWP